MDTVFNNSGELYEKLAEILNKIPNSFPKTSDGTHLRVLQKIFTQEEALIASKLKLTGNFVNELSTTLAIPTEKLTPILESMYEKGLIRAWTTKEGNKKFALMPFIVGIYEEQLGKMNKDLALLMDEYFQKSSMKGLFDTKPPIFKVVPINKTIKTELEIFSYDNAENIIKSAKSWGIRDCICKKQQEQLGNNCKYPTTVCLNFSSTENAFENNELTKSISKEEALNHLWQAEEAGLIHCSMNVKSGHNYICNCCTCCCGVLRGLTKLNQPYAFVKSNYIANIDEDECIGCELCVDRCQFNALTIENGKCTVNGEKCVGCGVCTIVCPNDSLQLVARSEDERNDPPDNVRDWMTQKAIGRGVDPSDII